MQVRGLSAGADDATVTIRGQAPKAVNLTGRVHNFRLDPLTGQHQLTCSMSLEPSSVRVGLRRRPNDVIGVDRGRFVRGYELTGNARRQACMQIANMECAGRPDDFSACFDNSTNACVAKFDKPDPCGPRGDFPAPR